MRKTTPVSKLLKIKELPQPKLTTLKKKTPSVKPKKLNTLNDSVVKPPKISMKPSRGTATLQSVSSAMAGGTGKTARTGRKM
jgi:hypothetical protein